MKYKITVTRIDPVEENTTEWQRMYDNESFVSVLSKDSNAKQYGYQQVVKEVYKEVEVYTQKKDGEIDLMAVISAFNGKEAK